MVLANLVYGVGWCVGMAFYIFLCFGKTNNTIYNTENVSNFALAEHMESAVSVKSA